MATPDPKADAFYVLRNGDLRGPFSREELRVAMAEGRWSGRALAQREGFPIWQPLSRILDAEDDAPRAEAVEAEQAVELPEAPAPTGESGDAEKAGAPGSLLHVLWRRALTVGVVCLAMGTAVLVGSRGQGGGWAAPWFVAAAAAALALLARWRAGQALALLAGAVCIPSLFLLLPFGGSRRAVEKGIAPEVAPAGIAVAKATPTVVAVVPQREAAPAPVPLPDAAEPPPAALPAPKPPTARATPAAVLVATPLAPAATPHASAPAVDAARPAEKPSPTESLARVVAPEMPPLAPATPPDFPFSPPTQPPGPAAAPASPASATPEDLIRRHGDAFIVVKDREGAGSGFICQVGGKAYLFTNIHVVAGMTQPTFTRLDGLALRPGAADAAVGHDILRFALETPPARPLTAMTDFSKEISIGDDVVVLGNSGGGGVITSIPGKVVGIGPDRIEVSAEFIPGNSGSPIIHMRTGQVVAVATYLTSRYEEFAGPGGGGGGSGESSAATPRAGPGSVVVRRFGYRLDSVRTWEPVNWSIFMQESLYLRRISLLTEDIFDFLSALRAGQQPSFATETLRRPATEWFNVVRSKGRSEADRLRITQGFLSTLRSMVRSDVAAVEGRVRYSFFREDLRQEREIRDRLYTAFDTQARRLASPSQR